MQHVVGFRPIYVELCQQMLKKQFKQQNNEKNSKQHNFSKCRKSILTGAFFSKFYAEFKYDIRFSWNLLKRPVFDDLLFAFFDFGPNFHVTFGPIHAYAPLPYCLIGSYTRTHACTKVGGTGRKASSIRSEALCVTPNLLVEVCRSNAPTSAKFVPISLQKKIRSKATLAWGILKTSPKQP